jgi:hypothetical protein
MKLWRIIVQFIAVLIVVQNISLALPSVEGKVFGIYPVSNEISLYKNVDDSGNDRGMTFQVVAINGFKLWTQFTFEFTGDFNWDMSYRDRDYYIELSLVKPVFERVSVNYQRILSTFEDEPVNQFGFRISF